MRVSSQRVLSSCHGISTVVVYLLLIVLHLRAAGTSNTITAVWGNDGGDKVSREELRATRGVENKTGKVRNRVWDGQVLRVFGAANETVSFNLVLEAGSTIPANSVSVAFDSLTGPDGALISNSVGASGNGVFSWVGRPIEMFLARYVEIKGISQFGWFRGDDRQMPKRFQASSHMWSDRPDHNKLYPDALVPFELVHQFNIPAGQNQSIWVDIYIPKGTKPGDYTGKVVIKELGVATVEIALTLGVKAFQLSDTPSVKAFSYLSANEIENRYIGPGYINWGTPGGARSRAIGDTYEKLFHRHGIDLIGGDFETPPVVGIHPFFQPRYSGELYTPAHGYAGRGVGVGTSVYSIGSYGTWGRNIFSEQGMWNFADPTAAWINGQFPKLRYFLYLIDEPTPGDFSNVENWSKWLASNPNAGSDMRSMTTVGAAVANAFMPSLDIAANGTVLGDCPPSSPNNCDNVAFTTQSIADFRAKPNREFWQYAAGHPGSGTSNTEDDGIAMRTLGWAQFKLNIDRWFYWWANLNTMSDWYQNACTWDCDQNLHFDVNWGAQSAANYTNGNGLLVYPGSDVRFPQDSYGVDGPIASLRLKEWRRGILDADYLAMANSVNPAATQAILQRTMPAALWENKAPGWPNGDPSYFYGGVSWSSDPDDWESAREQLAGIISNYCAGSSSNSTGTVACLTGATNSLSTDPTNSPGQSTSSPSTTVSVLPSPFAPVTTPSVPLPPTPSTSTQTNNGAYFVPITPCRVVDTRYDDNVFGSPALSSGESRSIPIPSGHCNIPQTAVAYSLNATVVPDGPLIYLTLWPTGQSQPATSNINSYDGRIKSTAAIVPAGTAGAISALAQGRTNLIIDVNGYFVSADGGQVGLQYFPITPCRAIETREGTGALKGPALLADSERTFPIQSSLCGIPIAAKAYSLNITAVPRGPLQWISIWPTGQTHGTSSVLNAPTGAVTANAAIVPAGTNGSIDVYSRDSTDLVVDITGYFADAASGGKNFFPIHPCRALDTRVTGMVQWDQVTDLLSAGCGIPQSAAVIALTATVLPLHRLDYLTLWPAGQNRPIASTLNSYDGQVSSNLALIPAVQGSVGSYETDMTHLIFDIVGYFQ